MQPFPVFPFSQDRWCHLCEPIQISSPLCSDCHLHSMTARVEEINGLAETVIGRPDHINPMVGQPSLAFKQRSLVHHFQGEMLNPFRRVRVSLRGCCYRQLEECKIASVPKLEKHVEMGAELLR